MQGTTEPVLEWDSSRSTEKVFPGQGLRSRGAQPRVSFADYVEDIGHAENIPPAAASFLGPLRQEASYRAPAPLRRTDSYGWADTAGGPSFNTSLAESGRIAPKYRAARHHGSQISEASSYRRSDASSDNPPSSISTAPSFSFEDSPNKSGSPQSSATTSRRQSSAFLTVLDPALRDSDYDMQLSEALRAEALSMKTPHMESLSSSTSYSPAANSKINPERRAFIASNDEDSEMDMGPQQKEQAFEDPKGRGANLEPMRYNRLA